MDGLTSTAGVSLGWNHFCKDHPMTDVINVSSGFNKDATVSSGVLMDVFDSGTAVSATVTDGGTQSVYAGGVAHGTMVDYGGVMSVGSGGFGSLATVNSGGAQYVYAGGAVSRTTLTDGATQYLSSGANAHRTEILSGGTQYVSSGATATNDLNRLGRISVGEGGTTIGTHLFPGGHELVVSGGFSSGTVVGGGMLVLEGGKAVLTVVEGDRRVEGHEFVVSGASDAGAVVTSNAIQIVAYGGTTTGTILSGSLAYGEGVQKVVSGGVAYGTRLYDGGGLVVSDGGRAIDTIVESGGLYNVDTVQGPGGTFDLLVSSGGEESLGLQSDRSVNATILAGGLEVVDGGTVIGTKLYGSSIVAGITSGAMIMSGGYELVQSGGVVSGATIAGGVLNEDTSTISGPIDFTSTGGEMIIDTKAIPTSFVVSGFVSGDSIQLAAVTYSAGATVAVDTPGVVTITNGGQAYNLNIAGAYVGEADFVFTSGSVLTKSATPQMQFLRPHVVATASGLDLTPSLDMFAARGGTMHPAAAPSLATSATASIGAVPTIVTSAPHPLVVPPHGV
jgi:autotransporter passenger strand-loop-strand repeat protein